MLSSVRACRVLNKLKGFLQSVLLLFSWVSRLAHPKPKKMRIFIQTELKKIQQFDTIHRYL